jgi:hypothetical protein
MMKYFVKIVFVLSLCIFISCKSGDGTVGSTHESLIGIGYTKIQHAKKIRETFDCVSFIANFENQFATQQWHTRFYIKDWYECVLAQDVEIVNGDLVLKGDLLMNIHEISKVDGRTTTYSEQRILKGVELDRFIESQFDLRVAGFNPESERPKPPEDFMKYWHELYPGN